LNEACAANEIEKIAYLHAKKSEVLCHNICVVIQEMFELGIKPKFFISQPDNLH
jgi:hypothetical protein